VSTVGWDLLWSTGTLNLKSIFTHYKEKKGNAQMYKLGGLGD